MRYWWAIAHTCRHRLYESDVEVRIIWRQQASSVKGMPETAVNGTAGPRFGNRSRSIVLLIVSEDED